MADLKDWFNTAAANNTGSAPDYPVEGQTPSSVNNTMREMMAAIRRQHEDAQWLDFGHTVTYASATTFTIPTDVTAVYSVNRRIRCSDASTLYGTITASSYSSPNTTVTVALDSGSLSVSLSTAALALQTKESVHEYLPNGNAITGFPSGTLMLFQQTAAPTGWTKQTTHNDKALRVVSGTASSGGTNSFSTCLNTAFSSDGHALTIAEMPAHNHGGGNHSHTFNVGASGTGSAESGNSSSPVSTNNSGTIINTQGSDTPHSHDISMDLQYVDIIIASKD